MRSAGCPASRRLPGRGAPRARCVRRGASLVGTVALCSALVAALLVPDALDRVAVGSPSPGSSWASRTARSTTWCRSGSREAGPRRVRSRGAPPATSWSPRRCRGRLDRWPPPDGAGVPRRVGLALRPRRGHLRGRTGRPADPGRRTDLTHPGARRRRRAAARPPLWHARAVACSASSPRGWPDPVPVRLLAVRRRPGRRGSALAARRSGGADGGRPRAAAGPGGVPRRPAAGGVRRLLRCLARRPAHRAAARPARSRGPLAPRGAVAVPAARRRDRPWSPAPRSSSPVAWSSRAAVPVALAVLLAPDLPPPSGGGELDRAALRRGFRRRERSWPPCPSRSTRPATGRSIIET